MIIEITLPIHDDLTLIAAWDFSDKVWNEKQATLNKFINGVLKIKEVKYQEKKWKENIIFELDAKPFHFYDIQNYFNDYFKSLGATILVN
jgi:hypothetical protein